MLLYPHTYRPEYRGTSGPVHVTVPHHLAALDHLFQDTLSSMNIKLIDDAMGGDVRQRTVMKSECNVSYAVLSELWHVDGPK